MLTNCLKKYPFSLLVLLTITVLSTFPIGAPEIARDVPLADKWMHMVMYAVLAAVLAAEYLRSKRTSPSAPLKESLSLFPTLFWVFLFPCLFGGLMELVQAYCTTYRSGDWLDFAADSIGAATGLLLTCCRIKLGSASK